MSEEIKELSEWLTNLIRANEASKSPDLPDWAKRRSQVSVYTIDDDVAYLAALTENNEKNRRLELCFIKYLSARGIASDGSPWPRNISVGQFLEWQQSIPEIKERWNTLQDLIDEIKKYDKSLKPAKNINDYIEQVIDYINSHDKIHLHKPNTHYGDPFGMLQITLEEDFFVRSQGEQEYILMQNLPLCLGIHNNRCVFAVDEFAVGCSFTVMAKKFTVLRSRKKKIVECTLTDKEREALTEMIFGFTYYVATQLKRRAIYPKIITFEAIDSVQLPENISTKIKKLWDDELHAIDVRTNTPLTENYMTMLGFLFSPVNKTDRVCMSFYSPSSGFGKTSFIENICERIDVNLQELVCSPGKANQFTFSYAIAEGPDILKTDDPMKSTEDVLDLVSKLVSNHTAPCELKGGAVKTVKNLFTKVLITSNVPLYMKSDTNNFLTEKLFELRTNEIEHCSNDPRVSDINSYIETCSDSEINNFLTKCINLYKNNPDWLKQHKGQYQDKDEIECKFSLIDPAKLRDTHNKTLLDCKRDGVFGYDEDRHVAYNDIQTQWHMMCKYIKTTWPKLADTCKCVMPTQSGVFSPVTKIAASRFKNYTLNDELRTKIRSSIGDDTLPNVSLADTGDHEEDTELLPSYKGAYEDLYKKYGCQID